MSKYMRLIGNVLDGVSIDQIHEIDPATLDLRAGSWGVGNYIKVTNVKGESLAWYCKQILQLSLHDNAMEAAQSTSP